MSNDGKANIGHKTQRPDYKGLFKENLFTFDLG